MSDLICITNRALCREDFLTRIEKIAAERPRALLLREKDLEEGQYKALAAAVCAICDRYNTLCILHRFPHAAWELGRCALHLPLPVLRSLSPKERASFSLLGASCHSLEEAAEAQALGCTYITAGHIFPTDCKKGLAPRGLPFLRQICEETALPTYAIGGICRENIAQVREAGAAGACVMSGVMACDNVKTYLGELS